MFTTVLKSPLSANNTNTYLCTASRNGEALVTSIWGHLGTMEWTSVLLSQLDTRPSALSTAHITNVALPPRQSIIVDITPHSIQPSSLMHSSLPPHFSYFHFHHPTSYVVVFSSHHICPHQFRLLS